MGFDQQLRRLSDPDPTTRRRALHAVGLYGRRRTQPELQRIVDKLFELADDPDKNVRNGAASAFGPLVRHSPGGGRWLTDAISHERARVRFMAARAFRSLYEPWEAAPSDSYEALLPLLTDEAESVRWAAASALVGAKGEARITGALVEATNDRAPTVRAAALGALGRRDDERAVQALVTGLKDADRRARLAASFGLEDPRGVPALIEALDDVDIWVRANAAIRLGRLKAVAAVPALLRKLESTKRDVRADASWALAEIGDERAVEPLLALFERATTVAVRVPVAEALGRLGDVRAIPVLTVALQHTGQERWSERVRGEPFYPLRRAAAEALRRIEGPQPRRLP